MMKIRKFYYIVSTIMTQLEFLILAKLNYSLDMIIIVYYA